MNVNLLESEHPGHEKGAPGLSKPTFSIWWNIRSRPTRALHWDRCINSFKHIEQILVNLIRNAKYAVAHSSSPIKRVIVSILSPADKWVQIQIQDNGVGIAPENLNRIFAHGFTTKQVGHGFGRHSSALAAKEMGGALHAHSDGLGHGTLFTLELPVAPPRAAS